MPSRKWLSYTRPWLLLVAFFVACTGETTKNDKDTWEGLCIDQDGDGFGVECKSGLDCDDSNASLNVDCGCSVPNDGCACEAGAEPVDCVVSREFSESGGMLCKTGVRYCQDGAWSSCTGIRSFEVPAPSVVSGRLGAAAINPDAALVNCDACRRDCYHVEDPIGVDGGSVDASVPNGTDVVYTPNGGITLVSKKDPTTTGPKDPNAPPPDISQCNKAIDANCDGLPDSLPLDYIGPRKVSSQLPAIYMELGPGEFDSRSFTVEFVLNSVDIYFLVDTTGSMGGSVAKLVKSLTDGNYLGSYTGDCVKNNAGVIDNELKKKGVTGAIACKIRDAAFGSGWFREVPFSGHASTWYLPFAHVQDISDDPYKTLTALTTFSPATSNSDLPEAGMVGLSAVATGAAQYLGWDRPGIPQRICPDTANTFGYPCFRKNAVPVVMLITDAEQKNGPQPSGQSSPVHPGTYGTFTSVNATPEAKYRLTGNTNETIGVGATNVLDGAAIDNQFVTYTGDTRLMNADLTRAAIGLDATTCSQWPTNSTAGSPGYPDAVFKFKVTDPNKTLTLSLKGSHHRPTLAVVPIVSGGIQASTELNGAGGTRASPTTIGSATWGTAVNYQQSSTFSTGYAAPQLPRDAYGRCTDNSGGTYSGTPASGNGPREAYYSFTPSTNMTGVTFRAIGDANPVIALYGDQPVLPEANIAITGASGANTNDDFSDFNIGTINGRYVRLVGGDTSVPTITAQFPAAGFQAANSSCSGATDASPDAVFDFTVTGTGTRKIRVETFDGLTGTNETASNRASFPHLVALVPRSTTQTVTTTAVTGNDTVATARLVESSSIPTAVGAWAQFTGSLASPMTANVTKENVYLSGAPETATCSNVQSSQPDAIYRFNVTANGTYDFDTIGSSGTTALSLHLNSVDSVRGLSPHAFEEVTATNATAASGQHLGTLNNRSLRIVNGTTASATNKWSRSQIGSGSNSNSCRDSGASSVELVYRFTVSAGSTIPAMIRFAPQFNGSISIYGPNGTTTSGPTGNTNVSTWLECQRANANATVDIERSFSAGEYYLIVHGQQTAAKGAFALSVLHDRAYNLGSVNRKLTVVTGGDTTLATKKWSSSNLDVVSPSGNTGDRGCRDGNSITSPEVVYRFTVDSGSTPANRNLLISLSGVFNSAALNVYRATSATLPTGDLDTSNPAWSQCATVSSGTANVTGTFQPGDYYVVVHGKSQDAAGTYTLSISDASGMDGALLGCSSLGSSSRLRNQVLTVGTYYVVVKGAPANYKLNIRRTPTAPSVLACNSNGLGTDRGMFEADLAAGDYSVVVRGMTAAQSGKYGVIMRDLGAAPAPLACANAAGYDAPSGQTATSFTTDLVANRTYWLAVRSAGTITADTSYTISIVNNSGGGQGWCAYDAASDYGAELIRKFPVGEYYAVIKGNGDVDVNSGWTIGDAGKGRGWYQFTIGDASLSQSGKSYKPPTWGTSATNGGVWQQLVDNKIRVITVTPQDNDGYKQKSSGNMISTATSATYNNAAIWKELKSDGTGLDSAIVDSIAELTENLAMDVWVNWLPLPDNPKTVPANNGNTFGFSAKAIATTGNGCNGISADGTRHLKCNPGAKPKFEITFTNPDKPNNIQPNPANTVDGGYYMQLALMGGETTVYDRIPVYIVPKPARADEPVTRFAASGTYTQDATSRGCLGTERPDWHTLGWNATIPTGTRLEWRVCTGDTIADLNACSYVLAAGVTSGPSSVGANCANDSQCASGYCDTAEKNAGGITTMLCHNPVGPSCSSNSDCGYSYGSCNTANKCVWKDNPISLRPSLLDERGRLMARVQVTLFANEERSLAPAIHDFNIEYTCLPQE